MLFRFWVFPDCAFLDISNLSIGSSNAYGCSITDFRMQQSIVSKSIQSEYGNGVPDSMDIYSRR